MHGSDGLGLTTEYPATLKQLHGFLAKTVKESLFPVFRFLQRPASRPVLTYGKRLYFRSQRQPEVFLACGENSTGFWLVRHGKHPSFRLHFLYLVYQCRWGQPRDFLHPPRFPGYACLSLVFYAKYAQLTPTSLFTKLMIGKRKLKDWLSHRVQVNLGLWNHLYQICCWQKSLSRTGSEMLRTFFLSEIPLLNVRWKSLSVIYKMIQLVKTHDVSKLDSLFDRACCDRQQISQLKKVLRNTFTDITFWPLKTQTLPPPPKILLENFQISYSSHRLFIGKISLVGTLVFPITKCLHYPAVRERFCRISSKSLSLLNLLKVNLRSGPILAAFLKHSLMRGLAKNSLRSALRSCSPKFHDPTRSRLPIAQ